MQTLCPADIDPVHMLILILPVIVGAALLSQLWEHRGRSEHEKSRRGGPRLRQ